MPKQTLKKIEKQIKDSSEQLTKLEIRPCQGDKDIKQKDIEIDELKRNITSLKKERDEHIYYWHKYNGNGHT